MNLALRFRKMQMNMAFINQSDGARKMISLVDDLPAVGHRRLCYLSIATRYCSPKPLRSFIDVTRGQLRNLHLDPRIAIAVDHAELDGLKRVYPALLCVYAVRARWFYHTKGYCLATYDGDDLAEGRLVVGRHIA